MSDFDLSGWLRRAQVQGIKLGLDNIAAALDALGDPQSAYPVLLVGGTNGKGSVVAMCEAMLQAQGLRVGATVSPHLTTYRERFRVDGQIIEEAELTDLARAVAEVIDHDPDCTEITYFELGIVLALQWFALREVDCAVVEVGMGGEFDATRAARPLVAALVSIDLDHVRHLGPTLTDIARTKARVAEAGMTVVVGERRADRLGPVIEEVERAGAVPVLAGRDFDLVRAGDGYVFHGLGRSIGGLHLGLQGAHQRGNAAVAVAAGMSLCRRAGLEPLSSEAVERGLAEAFVPGRQEETRLRGGAAVLLDGAHNGAGARTLAEALRVRAPRRRVWLFASLNDKERDPIYEALLPHVDAVWCCQGASTPRFVDAEDLVAEVRTLDARAEDVGTPAEGLRRADVELGPEDELLVAGSLYLIGDVRPLLGLTRC